MLHDVVDWLQRLGREYPWLGLLDRRRRCYQFRDVLSVMWRHHRLGGMDPSFVVRGNNFFKEPFFM